MPEWHLILGHFFPREVHADVTPRAPDRPRLSRYRNRNANSNMRRAGQFSSPTQPLPLNRPVAYQSWPRVSHLTPEIRYLPPKAPPFVQSFRATINPRLFACIYLPHSQTKATWVTSAPAPQTNPRPSRVPVESSAPYQLANRLLHVPQFLPKRIGKVVRGGHWASPPRNKGVVMRRGLMLR